MGETKSQTGLPAVNRCVAQIGTIGHDQDRIFVNKFIYPLREWVGDEQPIKRGDIVVLLYPNDPSKSYIKRVVGLPGEEVEVRDGAIFQSTSDTEVIIHLVARSFKYHRPRGVVGLGSEEMNALIGVGEGARHEPNLRATAIEIYEGMSAVIRLMAQHGINSKASQLKPEEQIDLSLCKKFDETGFLKNLSSVRCVWRKGRILLVL